MTTDHDLLIKSLGLAYSAYFEHGPRSTAKLLPLHGFFHDQIEAHLIPILGDDTVTVRSMKAATGEMKVPGTLYHKNVDIAVEMSGLCIGAVSLKFVVTNYKQNANNYFEHLMGETANIRSAGIPYASFSVIPIRPKYLTKAGVNARGEAARTEQLTRENLLKYINLFNLKDSPFRPDPLGLMIIDLDSDPLTEADTSGLGLTHGELDTMSQLRDISEFIFQFCEHVQQRVAKK